MDGCWNEEECAIVGKMAVGCRYDMVGLELSILADMLLDFFTLRKAVSSAITVHLCAL